MGISRAWDEERGAAKTLDSEEIEELKGAEFDSGI
jgi:hypothetical protein